MVEFPSVKKVLYSGIHCYFCLKAYFSSFRKGSIVVFDIDNTLADTWPSFLKGYKSEGERLKSIPPFPGVVNLVDEYYSSKRQILFLTARDYRYYFLTHSWLKNNINCGFTLLMVSHPQEKIKVLNCLSGCSVDYVDDLTHSHETGEVKYYSDVIEQVKRIPHVKYYDYDFIKRLQGRHV